MSNYTEWSDEMQERVARRASELGLSAMLPAEIVAKGERAGHKFRGNQYTRGISGGPKAPPRPKRMPAGDNRRTTLSDLQSAGGDYRTMRYAGPWAKPGSLEASRAASRSSDSVSISGKPKEKAPERQHWGAQGAGYKSDTDRVDAIRSSIGASGSVSYSHTDKKGRATYVVHYRGNEVDYQVARQAVSHAKRKGLIASTGTKNGNLTFTINSSSNYAPPKRAYFVDKAKQSKARSERMVPRRSVSKGDRAGHKFHGNQYTGGIGGGAGVGRGSASSASRIRREAMGGGASSSTGEAMRSRGGASSRALRASRTGHPFKGVAGSNPLTSPGGTSPNLNNKPWTSEEKAAARRGEDALERTLRQTRPELAWWMDDYTGPTAAMVLSGEEDFDWRDVQGSKPKAGPIQHPYDPEAAAHPKGYRPLSSIASEIRRDWGSKVNFGAKPYLDAMDAMGDISQNYGGDTGTSIAAYFLSNASSWKGDTARRVKAELKAMTKGTKIKRPSGYTPTTSGGTVIAQSRHVTAPQRSGPKPGTPEFFRRIMELS